MTAAELLAGAIASRKKPNKEVAAHLGAKASTFSRRISRNCLKAQELMDAAEYLGYKVVLVDADTEELVEFPGKSTGPRIRKQIDAVVYDTAKSKPICHTDPDNGWWMELFEADSGKFFVAHYTTWDGVGNFITLCPAEEAKNLRDTYAV